MYKSVKRKPKRDALVIGMHLHSSVILLSLVLLSVSRHQMMVTKGSTSNPIR